MPRFLLLVMTSIWTRISCSTTILEPSVPDGTSLTIDTANLVDPGTSNFNSKVAAIDGQSNLFTNGELTASNDEFCYNVPSKSKLRARGCVPSNLRTEPQNAPEGETKTPPKDHGGRDFQTPNEDIKANPSNQGSDQGETKPEEESGLPIQLTAKNPWLECRKYLRGILKYAVCDYPDPEFARYEPLPLVWLNAPFWSLSRCTLVAGQSVMGFYTCPHPASRVWCCWEWNNDVYFNVGSATGCLTLYFLQLAGDVFPPLPLLP